MNGVRSGSSGRPDRAAPDVVGLILVGECLMLRVERHLAGVLFSSEIDSHWSRVGEGERENLSALQVADDGRVQHGFSATEPAEDI